jgi:hypothetical protein
MHRRQSPSHLRLQWGAKRGQKTGRTGERQRKTAVVLAMTRRLPTMTTRRTRLHEHACITIHICRGLSESAARAFKLLKRDREASLGSLEIADRTFVYTKIALV